MKSKGQKTDVYKSKYEYLINQNYEAYEIY